MTDAVPDSVIEFESSIVEKVAGTTMTYEKIPCRLDEYQVSEIDGELLLYHAGKTEVLYLNEPAAMVWYLCDGERRVQDVVDLLCESYPDAEHSIADEVDDALRQFMEFGGIELK